MSPTRGFPRLAARIPLCMLRLFPPQAWGGCAVAGRRYDDPVAKEAGGLVPTVRSQGGVTKPSGILRIRSRVPTVVVKPCLDLPNQTRTTGSIGKPPMQSSGPGPGRPLTTTGEPRKPCQSWYLHKNAPHQMMGSWANASQRWNNGSASTTTNPLFSRDSFSARFHCKH